MDRRHRSRCCETLGVDVGNGDDGSGTRPPDCRDRPDRWRRLARELGRKQRNRVRTRDMSCMRFSVSHTRQPARLGIAGVKSDVMKCFYALLLAARCWRSQSHCRGAFLSLSSCSKPSQPAWGLYTSQTAAQRVQHEPDTVLRQLYDGHATARAPSNSSLRQQSAVVNPVRGAQLRSGSVHIVRLTRADVTPKRRPVPRSAES